MVAGYQADIDPDDFAPVSDANIMVRNTISNTLLVKKMYTN